MKRLECLQKHTLQLFEGDFAKLQEAYPELGASAVIRKLVQTHLSKINPPININKLKIEEPSL